MIHIHLNRILQGSVAFNILFTEEREIDCEICKLYPKTDNSSIN